MTSRALRSARGLADRWDMGDLVAKRWRAYGKDRLYVSTAGGDKVGWLDLVRNEAHLEVGADRQAFDDAVASWRGETGVVPASVVELPAPTASAEQAEPPVAAVGTPLVEAPPEKWVDLAANRAGVGPREQAVALRQAAPVRTFVARLLGVHTDERAWRLGAVGEEKVGAQLGKLPEGWRALHGIPVGERGSDIDHVVIGPGGVFTLNAKRHPDAKIWVAGRTFMVNGRREPYIRNSEFEASRASKLLTAACGFPVLAVGVIVPVDADDIVIKTAPESVHIVNRMRLVKWLRSRPLLLEPTQVEAVYDAARRLDTWQPQGRR